LEENPRLLTGAGHLAPLRAIPRFIDLLHAADVAGIVRPACPRCHRVVRLDKPLDGQRVCRNCIAKSRIEECVRCGARREPGTRDAQGRPLCPSCLITDPVNRETLHHLRRTAHSEYPYSRRSGLSQLPSPADAGVLDLWQLRGLHALEADGPASLRRLR
jgi:hypothetical protein